MFCSVFNRVAVLALLSAATVLSAQAAAKSSNRPSLQVSVSDPLIDTAPGTQWITDNSPLLQAGKTPAIPFAACPVSVISSDGATSGNGRAPTTRHRFIRTHYLITAAEMAARNLAGGSLVSGIGWTYSANPVTGGTGSLVIYLENSSDVTNLKSATWATAIATMTTAHNAATALPGTAGPFDVPFSGGTPFTYTGGSVYVAFDWQYAVGTQSTSAVIACNSTGLVSGLKGAQSATTPPVSLLTSSFRPETRLIANVANNDASSDFVMTYGALPLGIADPHSVRANVSNRGSNTLSNVPMTLNITGANSFTDTQSIAILTACDGTDYAFFAPFTPTTLGSNTVTASVPADDVNTNNSSSKLLDVTVNRYSYKHPGSTSNGGVGYNGGTGGFVALFSTSVATQVNAITVEFFGASATTYRLAIYNASGTGTPGTTQLYLDAADRTVTAPGSVTIRLPAPVSVGPGNFFVGIHQTNATNASFSFDNENPIRTGSFFASSTPASGPWSDFSPGLNFKLNVGMTLGACLVPLTVDVTPNGTSNVCVNTGVLLTATPAGGTGNLTYQWTENGIDIPGATASTYNAVKAAPGTFTYNVKITDNGGCINRMDSADSTVIWGAPGEVAGGTGPGNVLAWATDKTTLNWPVAAGVSTYNLYRGTLATLPALMTSAVDSCTRYSGAANTATGLVELPVTGDSYWYLVTGTNASGCEGTAGSGAGGPYIVNSSGVCP